MIRKPTPAERPAADRAAIRRRVKRFYAWFNQEQWSRCWALLDPRLRAKAKVDAERYAASLAAFKEFYGAVHIWYLRVNLHDAAARRGRDDRPFAYVYVLWQDDRYGFHLFRERWVKDAGRWYTRVVGLVPHTSSSGGRD
jgi:hypothetical protein